MEGLSAQRRKNSHSLSAQERYVEMNSHRTHGHGKVRNSSNSQIEDVVLNCAACTEHQNSNPKEPVIAHNLPDRPWQNVATDLFELDN